VRSLLIMAILAGGSIGCGTDVARAAAAMTGGDPERGRVAISAYGCGTCHVVPGVRGARGLVGPPLTNIASRVYLAGRVPNTPANMQLWIQRPHAIDEKTAMPETGVTDSDARDLAAYLYTLR
jgi:cytochrome c1